MSQYVPREVGCVFAALVVVVIAALVAAVWCVATWVERHHVKVQSPITTEPRP